MTKPDQVVPEEQLMSHQKADTATGERKAKLFSIRKAQFGDFLMLGLGLGWDKSDPSAALMVIVGKYVLMIGPHYPISN